MTQFTLTITRQVTGCGKQLKGSVQLTVTPSKAVDVEQLYVLDSSGIWATSDITSNLALDGTSTGLNASSVDATATVISNLVGTLGQIAIAAAAFAPPVGAPDVCSDAVLAALRDMGVDPLAPKTLKKQVDEDTDALAEATRRVVLLTAQVQLEDALKPQLVRALYSQSVAQSQLAKDQARLAKDLAIVSDTQLANWPLRASQLQTLDGEGLLPSASLVESWIRDPKKVEEIRKQFGVYFAIYSQAGNGSWNPPAAPATGDTSIGVPIRVAKMGRLVACTGTPTDKSPPVGCSSTKLYGNGSEDQLAIADQEILQLGRIYNVRVRGGIFKSEGAVIALDANTGMPTSVEVSEKVAAAAGATGAAKDTATQIAALPGQVAAAKLAATTAKTNQLTAETALASAVANAQVAGQVSSLTAQAALNTAATNQLTTLAALVAAQKNTQVADQTSALAAHTTLLNAQVAQLNAQAALTKAQALP